MLLLLLVAMICYLISTGVGVWGLNHPVMWGWAIVNFVWWIGIGHAGTLISAILFLLRQRWRTSINRAAEAMTIFAVMCAGHFPASSTSGACGLRWWLFPLPNSNSIWPQFRSPLMWDVFAVSTYFTVSAAVLVRGADARPGHPARPRHDQGAGSSSMACSRWAGPAPTATGAITRRPI